MDGEDEPHESNFRVSRKKNLDTILYHEIKNHDLRSFIFGTDGNDSLVKLQFESISFQIDWNLPKLLSKWAQLNYYIWKIRRWISRASKG